MENLIKITKLLIYSIKQYCIGWHKSKIIIKWFICYKISESNEHLLYYLNFRTMHHLL